MLYSPSDIIRQVVGWGFIGLGFIGLFLPILQGVLFILLGVALLAPYVPFFRNIQRRFYRRFPAMRTRIRDLKRKFRRKKKQA